MNKACKLHLLIALSSRVQRVTGGARFGWKVVPGDFVGDGERESVNARSKEPMIRTP